MSAGKIIPQTQAGRAAVPPLDILPCPFCRDWHGHVSQNKHAYYRECDCGARGPASDRHSDHHDERAYDRAIDLWNRRVVTGHPMYMAPRDGSAFLATGTHDRDDPPGAARGVKAGDRWWSILLFNVWQEPHRFVFAKDGAVPWSEPQRWCPLPELLAGDAASPLPLGATAEALKAAVLALRSYQHGNASPDLAREVADHCTLILEGLCA